MPTARSVRDVLGMGSMATVLKHFQAWQGTQARPAQEVSGLPRDLERNRIAAAQIDDKNRELAAAQQAENKWREALHQAEQEAAELRGRLQQMSDQQAAKAGKT